MPHMRYRCPACKGTVKSNTKWEWIGDLVLGVPLGLLVFAALVGRISWQTLGILFVLFFGGGWIAFPYVTKFDQIRKPTTVEQEDGQILLDAELCVAPEKSSS